MQNLAVELTRIPGISTSVLTLDRVFGEPAKRLSAVASIGGVPVKRIPFVGSRRYPLAPGVLRHVADADVVHVHGIDFFFDFLSATRVFHRRPLVASTHGGFFHTDFGGGLKQVYFRSVTRLSSKGYRLIFGSSESDASLFRRIAPTLTETIENGVNVSKWAGNASEALKPVMLCLGRFSSNKGIPDLFALLAALRCRGSRWSLIVAGVQSDLTAEDLKGAAAKYGVEDSVEIVVGADNDGIGLLIGRASYIVSASRYEGFGLSVVEGMSAGLTPFLSRIPPFERLIAASGVGGLFDPPDLDAAAEALLRLHASLTAERSDVRAPNIAAAARYGWADSAARFANAYRNVLKGK